MELDAIKTLAIEELKDLHFNAQDQVNEWTAMFYEARTNEACWEAEENIQYWEMIRDKALERLNELVPED